ncbi:adenylate/guanylate cyclase domain-containing protein [soil metagenome]
MASPSIAAVHRFRPGLRSFRLASGLILFSFAATHFLNHAAGLISIDAMDAIRDWRVAVTRSLPGTVILLGAAIVHVILGIWGFLSRRGLKIRMQDWIQLGFGLLIPLLLVRHIIGMRIAHEVFGVNDNYVYALWVMWPAEATRQAILMVLVWVHGCIGLHHWLLLKPWYQRGRWPLLGFAVLVPALAFAGFASAGRLARYETEFENPFTPEQIHTFYGYMDWALYTYLVTLIALIAARVLLTWADRRRNRITITYTGGSKVAAPRGLTLLEISRLNNIPHASVCGGRARCSTCRVRVIEGLDAQPKAGDVELKVLERVGAPHNVRLACQLYPASDLSVTTLLPAGDAAALAVPMDKFFWGVEQEVTILFSDLRGFTKLSEHRLSYDVVFLLNQYLGRMSEAIEDTGGYVDKFMGDGIMAIFGMDRPAGEGAAAAIAAARAMGGVLDALNQSLRDELGGRLDMGIGIHTGPAILGRIGAAGGADTGRRITALGDTVNTASRLESACKEHEVQLLISKPAMDAAGIPPGSAAIPMEITIRGRSQPLAVFAVKRATQIEAAAAAA